MNVKRFFAANSREALAMVRKALGPDAVILSNKAVNGGNEILALDGEEMDNLVAQESRSFGNGSQPLAKPAVAANPQKILMGEDALLEGGALSPEALAALASRKNPLHEAEPVFAKPAVTRPMQAGPEAHKQSPARQATSSLPATSVVQSGAATKLSEQAAPEFEKLMSEVRSMRGVIESQLTELVWENTQRRSPTASVLLRRLLSAGFGASLARQIAENMPQNQTQDSALNWAKSVLEKNLNTIDDESELLDKGGVFALIGPTGVGKTTTTAKLAARVVMKHGASKLGLITTDAYRIGGHEQLRIYGKILGVMVHAVKDEVDLKIALEELKGKHTILIDTVGVNQRDEMVTRQIAMLAGAGNHIKRLLCINATSTGETLMDVVNAYRGKGLAGCIMTKLDEAATIGSALDVIVREKLRLYYVANGQRVPEDLHVANRKMLVHHAFKLRKSPAGRHFQFRDEDLPLLMAHAARTTAKELSLG
ncbi:MAG: flagellar biosynthesis protein FlhF [Betaproteobacteria bacterium HGW-Betaproteobacteria-8]|nr:MAG: flagellar biosynthesis protein FlhF [Betaproteobacteria bacterium HGW-Betaproteobacteria-8]